MINFYNIYITYPFWRPRILLFNADGCPFPEVKRPKPKFEHSLSSSAEDKNEWSCRYTPPVCFHGTDIVSLNYVVLVDSENYMAFSNINSSLHVDFSERALHRLIQHLFNRNNYNWKLNLLLDISPNIGSGIRWVSLFRIWYMRA